MRLAAWGVALFLVAWLCLASALDRLARQGALVPAPSLLLSGGDALMARAWLAHGRGEDDAAWRLARAAVARRPIDAAALRVAGLIALERGEVARGDALMRLAGAAGWRDRPTQLFWAQAALDGGAVEVAAERLDAVARASGPAPARALLRRLELSAAGRVALAGRLRADAPWRDDYLVDVDGLDAAGLAARLATVTAAPPPRATRDRLAAALMARGQDALAWAVAGSTGPLTWVEGDGPFGWRIEAANGLESAVAGGSVRAHATGAGLLPLATRVVRLAPGDWRLAGAIAGATTSMPLLVGLRCLNGKEASAEVDEGHPGSVSARLTVPPGCPLQRLALAITGGEAEHSATLTIGALTLTRAAAAP